jgi:Spy/CpxP family protein refolding chaperone
MVISRLIVGGLAFLSCVCAAWAQPPGGGFGPFGLPLPGEILPGFLQDQLKLTAEQKKKLGELQKDTEANLAKLLTAEQKKSLDDFREGKGGFGFGPPGFGPGGPGGPGGKGGKGGGGPPGGMPGGPFGGGGPAKGGFPFGFGGATNDVQKKIGATDEEWKVIGPKVQKVIAARRMLSGDGGPMAGPFGGGAASNIVGQAQEDLKTVLDDPKHTKADVDEKIAAVRTAREKARADLGVAQRDLARLLTPDQQTIMISVGHLD